MSAGWMLQVLVKWSCIIRNTWAWVAPWDKPERASDYVKRKTNEAFSRRILSFSGTIIPATPMLLLFSVIMSLWFMLQYLWLPSSRFFPWSRKLLEAAGIWSNAQRAAKNVTTCKCQCFSNKRFFFFFSLFQILCHTLMSLRSGHHNVWCEESCSNSFPVSVELFHKAVIKAAVNCVLSPHKCLLFCCPFLPLGSSVRSDC